MKRLDWLVVALIIAALSSCGVIGAYQDEHCQQVTGKTKPAYCEHFIE